MSPLCWVPRQRADQLSFSWLSPLPSLLDNVVESRHTQAIGYIVLMSACTLQKACRQPFQLKVEEKNVKRCFFFCCAIPIIQEV
jgi:hypothetical protein